MQQGTAGPAPAAAERSAGPSRRGRCPRVSRSPPSVYPFHWLDYHSPMLPEAASGARSAHNLGDKRRLGHKLVTWSWTSQKALPLEGSKQGAGLSAVPLTVARQYPLWLYSSLDRLPRFPRSDRPSDPQAPCGRQPRRMRSPRCYYRDARRQLKQLAGVLTREVGDRANTALPPEQLIGKSGDV